MNQKYIEKLLHFVDEQTLKQIAENYEVTDSKTKEKIYHQICERRNAIMNLNEKNKKAGEQEMISETYHAPDTKSIPWTRPFGVAVACLIVMGGMMGGIWKLTRLQTPSEDAKEELKLAAENNSNTDTSATNSTESTTFSETSITTQALTVIATSADVTTTHTETSTTTASVMVSTTTATTMQTTSITMATTPQVHKETIIAPEREQAIINPTPAPIATPVATTEPHATAPPVETISTETEPVITRPAYLTAYLEICEEYEKDFKNLSYCLYDVDKDGTPELIIHSFSYWVSLYTYADNQVYELMDKWAYVANNTMGYRFHPEKNSIYYDGGEYAGQIYHHIYLTITPEHTLIEENVLTCVTNADIIFEENVDCHSYINGTGYYLNYEKTTEEEYNAFYSAHNPETYSLDYKSYSELLESLLE